MLFVNDECTLYLLFKTLNNELNNSENCDAFLSKLLGKKINSDVIVHVINALKPINEKLTNWKSFIKYSSNLLIEELGEKDANIILKAIV